MWGVVQKLRLCHLGPCHFLLLTAHKSHSIPVVHQSDVTSWHLTENPSPPISFGGLGWSPSPNPTHLPITLRQSLVTISGTNPLWPVLGPSQCSPHLTGSAEWHQGTSRCVLLSSLHSHQPHPVPTLLKWKPPKVSCCIQCFWPKVKRTWLQELAVRKNVITLSALKT